MEIPSAAAFMTQLVLPEQQQLFEYWRGKCQNGTLPCRDDISPTHFPRMLPWVSLVDYEAKTERFRIRLAGTQLREIYDCELTGCYVDDVGWGELSGYWNCAYKQIVDSAHPAQGVVRAPCRSSDHLVQFWLRLPLAGPSGAVEMILAYDVFRPAVEMAELKTICA